MIAAGAATAISRGSRRHARLDERQRQRQNESEMAEFDDHSPSFTRSCWLRRKLTSFRRTARLELLSPINRRRPENCPDTFKENSSFFIGRFFSER